MNYQKQSAGQTVSVLQVRENGQEEVSIHVRGMFQASKRGYGHSGARAGASYRQARWNTVLPCFLFAGMG